MSVYDNSEELCQWLRDNSSGNYRPSAHAAYTIESMQKEISTLKAGRDKMRAAIIKEINKTGGNARLEDALI